MSSWRNCQKSSWDDFLLSWEKLPKVVLGRLFVVLGETSKSRPGKTFKKLPKVVLGRLFVVLGETAKSRPGTTFKKLLKVVLGRLLRNCQKSSWDDFLETANSRPGTTF